MFKETGELCGAVIIVDRGYFKMANEYTLRRTKIKIYRSNLTNIQAYLVEILLKTSTRQGWGGGHFFEPSPPPWPKNGTASASRLFAQ